jgi:hypothetical protein
MISRDDLDVGDIVAFEYRGQEYQGLVSSINVRVTVIVPVHGKFYIPVKYLTKLKGRRSRGCSTQELSSLRREVS